MEINQRLSLLNQRLDVIGDLVSLVLPRSGYVVGLTTFLKKVTYAQGTNVTFARRAFGMDRDYSDCSRDLGRSDQRGGRSDGRKLVFFARDFLGVRVLGVTWSVLFFYFISFHFISYSPFIVHSLYSIYS